MSHKKYQTEAIILGNHSIGEANRFVDMFTKDFGRLKAVARSVREERSKLRVSLQDFSILDISLVRGREVWRVVGANSKYNFYNELIERTEERDTVVRLLFLLKRLLNGEEENNILYTAVSDSISFLCSNTLNSKELNDFECLVALRILYNLGYLTKDNNNAHFLETADVTLNIMSHISPIRFDMIKQINTSLQESQL